MKKLFLAFFMILIFSSFFSSQDQKPLEYFVSVNVRIVPLFVIDSNGDPIFDLKKEELQLFINGKETPLQHLLRRDLSLEIEQVKIIGKTQGLLKQAQERIVFILLDTVFNDRFGTRRMKIIAEDIIKTGSDFDSFVVIGIGGRRGLFYIAGPEHSSPELLKKIQDIKLVSMMKSSNSFSMSQGSERPQQPNIFARSYGFMDNENVYFYLCRPILN